MLKILKDFFKITTKKALASLFIGNFIVLVLILILSLKMMDVMSLLQNAIEIYGIRGEQQREEIINFTKKIAEVTIDNIRINIDLIKNIQELTNKIIVIEKQNQNYQTINIINIKEIKEANLIIYNSTLGVIGSGSHIKIKGESYVLTVAHLLNKKDDILYGIANDNILYPLQFEKMDKTKDLALFKINGIKDLYYLEISDEFPDKGSEITIIGKPADLEDAITNGIIMDITKYNYIFTNLIYYGSSGGAVLYKGKIVGVVSAIKTYWTFPFTLMNCGYSCNLKAIQEFLAYIK